MKILFGSVRVGVMDGRWFARHGGGVAGLTIFEEMSALARAHGAVNLGQGFPDDEGPLHVRKAAARAVMEGPGQYPPMAGTVELRRAVAGFYARHHGLAYDPDQEITVTSGATEALAAAILALVRPGDEVVLFQPMYDAYLPLVLRAGGVPRFVTLRPPAWRVDVSALEAVMSARTRLLIHNNPLNPAGSMADVADLEAIAEACVRQDVVALSDEVWEAVVLGGARHTPLAALPGMRERTIKLGSGGKIFALTGWKVGWTCAPPELTRAVRGMHQFLTFTTAPAMQAGIAVGLDDETDWLAAMRGRLERARARLADGLADAGYAVLPGDGTYFLNVDLAASGIAVDDRTFARAAVAEHGVATIPVSAFYAQDAVTHLVRLCFAKVDATLDAGVDRMARARAVLGG